MLGEHSFLSLLTPFLIPMKTLWIFENSYYVPAKSFFPSRPWTYSVSFHHFSRDSPTGSRTGRHDLLSFEQTPQCLTSCLRNSWYSENVRWSELKWSPHANPKPQENSPPFQGNAEKVFMGRNYQHGSPVDIRLPYTSFGHRQGQNKVLPAVTASLSLILLM